MRRLMVFAVKDVKSGSFALPFCSPTPGTAERNFAQSVNGGQEAIVSAHPEDFELWQLGEFDDTSGQLIPQDPVCLVNGAAVKR